MFGSKLHAKSDKSGIRESCDGISFAVSWCVAMTFILRRSKEPAVANPSLVHPPHTSADFGVKAAPDSPQAASEPATPLSTKEDFARRWKFASFLEMFEATAPVGNAGGKKKWLLTALRAANGSCGMMRKSTRRRPLIRGMKRLLRSSKANCGRGGGDFPSCHLETEV